MKIATNHPSATAVDPRRPRRVTRYVVQVPLSEPDFRALTEAAEAAGTHRPGLIRSVLRAAGVLPSSHAAGDHESACDGTAT